MWVLIRNFKIQLSSFDSKQVRDLRSTKGIYILLGSNLGDRMQVLHDTKKLIQDRVGEIIDASAIYETEPWGVSDQPSFYNQVVKLNTPLDPHALLLKLQEIESSIGKIKLGKWRERLIDIDILYYDQCIVDEEKLHIPHPEIQNRRFTLFPLCEIAPDFINPVLQKTQKEMLLQCDDQLAVLPLFQTSASNAQ